MDIKSWIGVIELISVFGLFILFCWWQLRSLDKLDKAEADKEELEVTNKIAD